MSISRRVFLKNGGIAAASVGLLPAFGPAFLRRAAYAAGPENARRRKVLICVFQRGAADGLSMVVPYGDPDLYMRRPTIGIPQPGRGGDGSALDLDGFFGLHPALAPFLPVYKEGHLAVVHACGSPDGTRSHFDAQDYMESGSPGNKSVSDGWLARTALSCPQDQARKNNPFRAVAVGGGMPRSLQGDAGALAVPDLRTFGIGRGGPTGGGGRRAAAARRDEAMEGASAAQAMMATGGLPGVAGGFETLYDQAVGDVLHGPGSESFEAIKTLQKLNLAAYAPSNGARYPVGRFGDSLQQIAQLVKADVGLEIAFAETGGWDTHVNQGTAQGQLATRLREFGQGIAALYRDLGDRMDDVVILTMSEFGRTARQNGNLGTDHGHGTCFFALGGGVNGGKVLGKWPGLGDGMLYENRDLAITTDFRAVFGEVALRHLGAKDALPKIFPGYAGSPADFRGVVRTA
ncbi:MAG TPA: DUF1501 domain-containing protein [Armatimonadaceae bacterium]|nr:DUF1501 domain-containing protein [Armatimonadaceae bacterium]